MTKALCFYDCKTAPSPRRARIFLAEKNLNIPTVEVDLANKEQLSVSFRAINPRCTVPVLTLDDGTVLTENAGIAAFLEDFQPSPPLLGTSPVSKGLVASWNARVELEGLIPIADAFRNRSKGLKDRAIVGPTNFEQIPELAERGHARGIEFLETLDTQLKDNEYVAGDSFSVADITAICVVDFASWVKITPAADQNHLQRWLKAIKSRPSCKL